MKGGRTKIIDITDHHMVNPLNMPVDYFPLKRFISITNY